MQPVRAYVDTLLIAAIVALLAAIIIYFVKNRHQAAVDAAFRGRSRGEALRFFDLSHGNVVHTLEGKYPVTPERLWTYDARYLERFARAGAADVPGQGSALELYINWIWRWDIAFAVALGLFAALLDFGIALGLSSHPYASRTLLLCGCMGLVYAAADVAEDLKLASILSNRGAVPATSPAEDAVGVSAGPHHVDPGEAAAANFLTRIKIVSLTLSVSGAVIFVVLSIVSALIKLASGHSIGDATATS